MGSQPPAHPLRQVLEGQLSRLSTEVERLFDEFCGRARHELADQLNQSVRRLRQATSLDELAATMVDAAMAFADGAALFRIAGAAAKGGKVRGVAAEVAAAFDSFEIPLSAAPALAGAVESRDPVIAVTTGAEVSAGLITLASHPEDGRAHIFPLVVRERVPALLYCWGTVQGATLEMLAQVGAAVWDLLAVPETPQLVTIAAAPVPAPAPPTAGNTVPARDEAIHLRAQRFARVRVAEMRLRDEAAVESGRSQRNLYGALRVRIDDARAAFRQSYLAPGYNMSCNMTDYFHVELLRTLAHDDADLLGKDYPGPLC
jgi:hypothetical protein